MNAETFSDYALSQTLSPDAIYTVELLIERVRGSFDANYWDEWSARCDAREVPGYMPQFSKDHVRAAEEELKRLCWLSFQRTRSAQRPVRDICAIQLLSELSGLVLINNEVTDISALAGCTKLKNLFLRKNPIRDISVLGSCTSLEELDLGESPIDDFSVLQILPKLRELSLSTDQIAAFRRLDRLPSLRKLKVGLDTLDSFEGFPQMSELRVVISAHVASLRGLESFPKLENLVNLSGEFDSLEPLRNSKNLTHANILASRIDSLKPLAGLSALRDLYLNTEVRELDLSPLELLPALHEVTVKCGGEELPSVGVLRTSLPSWDVEFRASTPRYTPSLDLEIVDQATFDLFDTGKPFNLTDSDTNEGLLGSELDWLDDQIEEVFSVDFVKDEDYTIPYKWGGARSRTVVLLSDRAFEAFARLVIGIQRVLSQAKNDWIIYFQSDEVDEEFIVWIYPEKIVLAEEYEKCVRGLIEPK